jgi:hypothetical protein
MQLGAVRSYGLLSSYRLSLQGKRWQSARGEKVPVITGQLSMGRRKTVHDAETLADPLIEARLGCTLPP